MTLYETCQYWEVPRYGYKYIRITLPSAISIPYHSVIDAMGLCNMQKVINVKETTIATCCSYESNDGICTNTGMK